jgi:hypothetical protein
MSARRPLCEIATAAIASLPVCGLRILLPIFAPHRVEVLSS